MPETRTIQATFLVQGFKPQPWGISSKLREMRVSADVRFRTHPKVNGHRAVLDLQFVDDEPISSALTSSSAAERLAGLAQWLCDRSTAVQLLIQVTDSDEVGEYIQIPPIMLSLLLPQVVADGKAKVFFLTSVPCS